MSILKTMLEKDPPIVPKAAEPEAEDETTVINKRHTNIDYEEIQDKKTKLVAKVIAKLEGVESAKATKLAKKYDEVNKRHLAVQEERNQINQEITDYVLEYFDSVEDILCTRIIQSCQLTLQLSKTTLSSESTEVDFESVCAEMTKFLNDEMIEELEKLKAKYSSVKKVAGKKPSLTVKLEEGLMDSLKRMLTMFVANVKHHAKRSGAKLMKIAEKYGIENEKWMEV